MATLPDPSGVTRVGYAGGRAVASYRGDAVSNAASQLGAEMVAAGADAQRVLYEEKQHIAGLQAQDAFNKLRQKQIDLTSGEPADKTTGLGGGYLWRKGGNVVNTPEGSTAFLDDYRQQFKTASETLGSGLTGLAKQHYDQLAQNASVDFQTGLVHHSLQEADSYDKQTLMGTLAAEAQAAGAKWDDPAAIENARNNVLSAVNQRLSREGLDGTEAADAARKKALSEIHTQVLDSALAAGDAKFADAYLKTNKNDMSGESVMQSATKVNALIKLQVSNTAAANVSQQVAARVLPTDFGRLSNQVALAESGAKQFDKAGNPIVSSAGAVGKMQIMPKTGPEAAKLAGLPWDEQKLYHDEKYNEALGSAYLSEMLRQFDGDMEKALAAYNAGAGNVRKAVKGAEKFANLATGGISGIPHPEVQVPKWQDLLPKPEETKPYIAKIMAGYNSGATPAEPNILDVRKMAADEVKHLAPDARPDVIEAAQAKAERDFNDVRAAREQNWNSSLENLRAQVDAGAIKDFSQVPPSALSSIGPKREELRKYIDSSVNAKADASPAVMSQFYDLSLNPNRLLNMQMPEIMGLAPEIGRANVDKLLSKRAEYQKQPELATNVDADMLRSTAIAYGVTDKADQVALKDRAETAILAAQSEGKALKAEDKRKIIRDLALELPKVNVPKGGFFGLYDTTKSMRGYQVTNPQNIIIPDDYKKKIEERAKASGVVLRSDVQWREAYRALLQEEMAAKLSKG